MGGSKKVREESSRKSKRGRGRGERRRRRSRNGEEGGGSINK